MTLSYHLSSGRFEQSDSERTIADKLLECCRKDHKFFQHLQIAFDRFLRFNLCDPIRFRCASDFAHEISSWNIERIEWSWKTGCVRFFFRVFNSNGYQNLDG